MLNAGKPGFDLVAGRPHIFFNFFRLSPQQCNCNLYYINLNLEIGHCKKLLFGLLTVTFFDTEGTGKFALPLFTILPLRIISNRELAQCFFSF